MTLNFDFKIIDGTENIASIGTGDEECAGGWVDCGICQVQGWQEAAGELLYLSGTGLVGGWVDCGIFQVQGWQEAGWIVVSHSYKVGKRLS